MNVADIVMTFEGVAAGSLPSVLRKAMVDKFAEFDEYQLAKYNRDRKGVMVGGVYVRTVFDLKAKNCA